MERARELLLVLALVTVLVPVVVSGTSLPTQESDSDGDPAEESRGAGTEPDDEGDSASFTVTVEREDGGRCGGSLVSVRTVLTSARCARAHLEPLWVRARPGPVRRVTRLLVLAVPADADLALLELEAALGPPARPILMATDTVECAAPAVCHVVRASGRSLRIVDEDLVPVLACSALVPRDSSSVLCLRGARLCSADRGAGVVCGGKLCGVIGGSILARDERDGGGEECGTLHVAEAVARRRRFLHCAHRPTACARGGECGDLCTETLLLEDESVPAPATRSGESPTPTPPAAASPRSTRVPPLRSSLSADSAPWVYLSGRSPATLGMQAAAPGSPATRTLIGRAPSRSTPIEPTPESTSAPGSTRPAREFEPNRPDFKVPTVNNIYENERKPTRAPGAIRPGAGLSRQSGGKLAHIPQPGEYGDNAAEYCGEEPAPPPPPSRTDTTARSSFPSPRARAELAARVSPAVDTQAVAGSDSTRGFLRTTLLPVMPLLLVRQL